MSKRKLKELNVNQPLPSSKLIAIKNEVDLIDNNLDLISSQTDANIDIIASQLPSAQLEDDNDDEIDNLKRENPESYRHYSVQVFEESIQTVIESESFLFLEDELAWWEAYQLLSENSKYLLARIYLRKLGWLRVNQLTRYFSNSQDLTDSVLELNDRAFLHYTATEPIELFNLLNHLTLPEVKQLIKQLKFTKISLSLKKQELIEVVLKFIKNQPNLFQFKNFFINNNPKNTLEFKFIKDCLKLTGELIQLKEVAWSFFNRAVRVFTRFRDFDGHAMAIAIRTRIGRLHFVDVEVTRSRKVFPDRESLIDYEAAVDLLKLTQDLFHTKPPKSEYFEEVCNLSKPIRDVWKSLIQKDYDHYPSHYMLRFTPGWVYTSMMGLYVASLARLRRFRTEEALLLELLSQSKFRPGKRGAWWTRLCLIQSTHLAKSNQSYLEKSYETCIEALEDRVNGGIDPGSANAIYARLTKLQTRLKMRAEDRYNLPDPRPPAPPVITIYGERITSSDEELGARPMWCVEGTDDLVSVEQFALHHLTRDGYRGFHGENSILTTIFALLFFDILFQPKDGAFETKFQSHPVDLGTEAFYLDRKAEIEARFAMIGQDEYESILTEHYDTHCAKRPSVVGLNWEFELTDLLELTACIGGTSLARVCVPFCKDYFHYSSGMPDLW